MEKGGMGDGHSAELQQGSSPRSPEAGMMGSCYYSKYWTKINLRKGKGYFGPVSFGPMALGCGGGSHHGVH